MKLGFVTAAFPKKTLEELVLWGNRHHFKMIEVACWPTEHESRRYAGTQHIDVESLTPEKILEINALLKNNSMEISSLAYYPNPLDADLEVRNNYLGHLRKVITAASKMGVPIVGTFVGRDKNTGVEESLVEYKRVFDPIVAFAKDNGVKIAIENCPMLWSDRWPGGNNIASTPAIWERMFDLIDSDYIGLNYDPSHLVWQQIDCIKALYEFKDKIFHTHAKDTKMLPDVLARTGIYGFNYYLDKIAGLGDIDWKRYFSTLYELKYEGAVSIEPEDRSWEKDDENILDGIELSRKLLSPYIVE